MSDLQIIVGDCRETLKELESESIQCCCTSPPYFGLRSYSGGEAELGQEPTPEAFVQNLVQVFREVRRVLKSDGTLWLNLGDTYAGSGNGGGGSFAKDGIRCAEPGTDKNKAHRYGNRGAVNGVKSKDLIGIPWMTAFALRADGWFLRSEITWCKRAPMPESVQDRPTSATEKIFLFSKSPRYLYNAGAVRLESLDAVDDERRIAAQRNGNKSAPSEIQNGLRPRADKQAGHSRRHAGFNDRWDAAEDEGTASTGANLRNFWCLSPEPYAAAHFATFPTEIPRRAILIGSNPGDTVLDCFGGSGTTGMVALELGRKAILCELNPEYAKLAEQRTNVTPGLAL